MSGEVTSSPPPEGRNYWAYMAVSGATVTLISGVALGVLLGIYTPWVSSAALAAAGGLPIFIPPGALLLFGITTFAIATVSLVICKCRQKTEKEEIQEEVKAYSEDTPPTVDSNHVASNEEEVQIDLTEVEAALRDLKEQLKSAAEQDSNKEEEILPEKVDDGPESSGDEDKVDPKVDHGPPEASVDVLPEHLLQNEAVVKEDQKEESVIEEDQQGEGGSSVDKTEGKEVTEDVSSNEENSSTSSVDEEEEMDVEAIKAEVQKVIEKTFDPVIDEGVKLLLRLLGRHPSKEIQQKEKVISDAVDNLRKIGKSFSNNDYFLLKQALDKLLKIHGTNRNRRKIGAALYLDNEEQLETLLDWQDELVKKRELHGIIDLIADESLDKIKEQIPALLAKTFSQDNQSMIALMEDFTGILCDAFTDKEWKSLQSDAKKGKKWLATEKAENAARKKGEQQSEYAIEIQYYAIFSGIMRKKLFEVFEREFEKAENERAFQELAAQLLENRFLKTGMAKKVGGMLRMFGKAVDTVEQLLDPNLNSKTIKIPTQHSLYITENADIGDLSEDENYHALIDLQYEINDGKKSKDQIALFLIPKTDRSEKAQKAIKVLRESKGSVIPKHLRKITSLQRKFKDHTIIVVKCSQQGGINEFSTLKKINGYAGTINGMVNFVLGSLLHAIIQPLKTKKALETETDDWEPVVEPKSGWNFAAKSARVVIGLILDNIVSAHTKEIEYLNLPGVDDKDLAEFHKAIITLVRLLAAPAIDTLFGDMKNKFRRETIYKLAIEKGALEYVGKALLDLSESLKGEVEWSVFAKSALELITHINTLLDEIEED